ncbi:MAG: endonuclease III [Candidatus Latescibacteria bacterium]|nr:endonuclease III [Candidatus Latescibacterota bacterium]
MTRPPSRNAQRQRAADIVARLKREFPDARCALDFSSPLELLIATILSAQCTDDQVNRVTAALFRKYRTAQDYVDIPLEELEQDIRSTGFFHNKAKSIKHCCQALVERHGGAVPTTMEALVALGGVGRKTANVVLGNAFGIPGIAVDTHVKRLAGRLGLSSQSDPDKIEHDLMALIPRSDWIVLGHLFAAHGRKTCLARTPRCERCGLNDVCPSATV